MITRFEEYKTLVLEMTAFLDTEIQTENFASAIIGTDFFDDVEKSYITTYLENNKWEDLFSVVNEGFSDIKSGIVSKLQSLWKNVKSFATQIKDSVTYIIKEQLQNVYNDIEKNARLTYIKLKKTEHKFNKELLLIEAKWFKDFATFLTKNVLSAFTGLLEKSIIDSGSVSEGLQIYGLSYLDLFISEGVGGEIKGMFSFLLNKIKGNRFYQTIEKLLNATKEFVEIIDNHIADKINKGLLYIAKKAKSLNGAAPDPPAHGFESSGVVVNVVVQTLSEATAGLSLWTISWQKLAVKTTLHLLKSGIPGYHLIYYSIYGIKTSLTVKHTMHLLHHGGDLSHT